MGPETCGLPLLCNCEPHPDVHFNIGQNQQDSSGPLTLRPKESWSSRRPKSGSTFVDGMFSWVQERSLWLPPVAPNGSLMSAGRAEHFLSDPDGSRIPPENHVIGIRDWREIRIGGTYLDVENNTGFPKP